METTTTHDRGVMKSLVFRPSSIIGLTEQDGKQVVEKNNLSWRVTKRDGEYFIMNRYISDDRISMHIEGDKIVDAYIG